MITILVFFIILSVLVVIHELGHFIAAKKNGVYVEEFGFGLPPRIFGIKVGETLYSLNLLPFGGFVKVLGEEEHELEKIKLSPELKNRTFVSKRPAVKILILTAGVIANFLLGWAVVTYLFIQGVPSPTQKVLIEKVTKNSPAQQVGIAPDDQIVGYVNNKNTTQFKSTDEFIDFVKAKKGSEIALSIKTKDAKTKVVNITPRQNPPKGEGSLGVVLTPFEIKQYVWYKAPFYGLIEAGSITVIIVRELVLTLARLVTFQPQQVDVAGPVGIAKITGEAVKYGYLAVLQLLGLLSLNLAVINIMPFPALDGGRLAFVLYETITKRKINPEIEKRLNFAGFAILMSLIVLITVHDIFKLVIK